MLVRNTACRSMGIVDVADVARQSPGIGEAQKEQTCHARGSLNLQGAKNRLMPSTTSLSPAARQASAKPADFNISLDKQKQPTHRPEKRLRDMVCRTLISWCLRIKLISSPGCQYQRVGGQGLRLPDIQGGTAHLAIHGPPVFRGRDSVRLRGFSIHPLLQSLPAGPD